jgi:hypothetical protein
VDPHAALSQEAKRIQASGVLGEAKMRRLFDYLVASSPAAEAPKEITIAIDVFGKGPDFDVSQDALVRVYMHKLRRTLEEFYAANGGEGITPLRIPRGEYRLTLNPRPVAAAAANQAARFSTPAPVNSAPSDAVATIASIPAAASASLATSAPLAASVALAASAPPAVDRRTRQPFPGLIALVGIAVAGAILLTLLTFLAFGILQWRAPPTDLELARANPIWSAILRDDRPLLVVVGDYYLIGETDDSMEVKRLIREYSVNSKDDLDNYLKQHPDAADRYMDVGLRYLPTSVAFALRDVMPVLETGKRRVSLSMVSDVTPAMLKSSNIVYIGYLSGLGIMQQLVFAGSRFAIGQSYDELLDTKTKHLYISQTASQNIGVPQSSGKESSYRDYGFFSSFHGPGGNTVIVISGTRDEGVRQTAEAFTSPAKLRELRRQADAAAPFDALLEVSALDGVNLSGKVLIESQR